MAKWKLQYVACWEVLYRERNKLVRIENAGKGGQLNKAELYRVLFLLFMTKFRDC